MACHCACTCTKHGLVCSIQRSVCRDVHPRAQVSSAVSPALHSKASLHGSRQHLVVNAPAHWRPCRRQLQIIRATADSPEQTASLPDPQPVTGADGQPASLPNAPGIYAIYDAEGALQYVGMSRKVPQFHAHNERSTPHRLAALVIDDMLRKPSQHMADSQGAGTKPLQLRLSTQAAPQVAVSVANHQQDLPERVHAVAVLPVQDASRDALTAAWTSVVQEQGGHARSACSQTAFSSVPISLCLATSGGTSIVTLSLPGWTFNMCMASERQSATLAHLSEPAPHLHVCFLQ